MVLSLLIKLEWKAFVFLPEITERTVSILCYRFFSQYICISSHLHRYNIQDCTRNSSAYVPLHQPVMWNATVFIPWKIFIQYSN